MPTKKTTPTRKVTPRPVSEAEASKAAKELATHKAQHEREEKIAALLAEHPDWPRDKAERRVDSAVQV